MKKRINWVVVLSIILIGLASSTFGWKVSANTDINKLGDEKVEVLLKKHMKFFTSMVGERNINNYENLEKGKKYIIDQFTAMGYNIKIEDFEVNGKCVSNVIASSKGIYENNPKVVIGAHYDSIGQPSANGGATPISSLLALAEIFKESRSPYDVEFVAFVNKEKPFMKTDEMGSLLYAKSLKEKNVKIKGAIVIESLGCYSNKMFSQRYPFIGYKYPNKGNFVSIVYNKKSKDFNDDFVTKFKLKSNLPLVNLNGEHIIGADLCDSYSFWKENFGAIVISDTSIFRMEDINRKKDVEENINYKYMSEIIKNINTALTNY